MKKTLLTKIKKALLEERETILSKQSVIIDIDTSGDEVDIIQSNIIINTHKQLLLRNKNRLQHIGIALSKIDEGTYGICEECEEPINIERMKVNTICKLCIFCAEQLERASKNKK